MRVNVTISDENGIVLRDIWVESDEQDETKQAHADEIVKLIEHSFETEDF